MVPSGPVVGESYAAPRTADGIRACYELRLGEESFRAVVADGRTPLSTFSDSFSPTLGE